MRNITPPAATFQTTDFGAIATPSSSTITQSALQETRAAIARWSGSANLAAARRDLAHVSPQARWLAKAQQDLAAWIDCGGFSQIGDAANPALPPLPGLIMYDSAPSGECVRQCRANACCD